jgi:hypothetical protein
MQVIPQQHNRQVPSSPMKELPSTPVASAVVGDEPATSTAATAAAASGPSSSMMESIFVPSDTELTLLCWDYLRQSTNAAMRQKQQEHAAAVDGQEYAPPPTSVSLADQYKTIATWALYQSLLVEAENSETADSSSAPSPEDEIVDTSTLPPLEDMQESLARYQASISLLHPTMTATTTTTGDFDENKESKEPDEGVRRQRWNTTTPWKEAQMSMPMLMPVGTMKPCSKTTCCGHHTDCFAMAVSVRPRRITYRSDRPSRRACSYYRQSRDAPLNKTFVKRPSLLISCRPSKPRAFLKQM